MAALKTAFGVALLWVVAPAALPAHPMLAGWLAMAGVVFVLHFGTFHLLSLAWRRAGVNAMPVMRHPLRSESLADFWDAGGTPRFTSWPRASLLNRCAHGSARPPPRCSYFSCRASSTSS
jgi:hypothetical protein